MMVVLVFLIVLSVISIGIVLYLLKKESEFEGEEIDLSTEESQAAGLIDKESAEEKGPAPPEKLNLQPNLMVKLASIKDKLPKPTTVLGGALKKFNLNKKDNLDVPTVKPLPSLKEYYATEAEKKTATEAAGDQEETHKDEPAKSDESDKNEPLSAEEEKGIEKEIELTADLSELKEKYNKLDSMFNEKSAEFEKTKESLNNELKNRKDFNKVKDILEKELKNSKEKTHSTQAELSKVQAETESQRKRSEQLDEKATKLEKDLLKKEDKISELTKQTQSPAIPLMDSVPEPNKDLSQKEEKIESPPPTDQPQAGHLSIDSDVKEYISKMPVQGITPSNQAPSEAEPPNQEETPAEIKESSPLTENNDANNNQENEREGAADNQSQVEQFLKLQPDVLANEPKKEEPVSEEPVSPEEKPNQTDGFKLDLSIDDFEHKPKAKPENEPPEDSDNPKP